MNFERLSQFALQSTLSDFTISLPAQISKNPISTHRIILAANSLKFSELFKKDNELSSFNLPVPVNSIEGDTTEDFILTILKIGYNEQTVNKLIENGLTESNAFRFYSAAQLLDFTHCRTLLEEFIEQRNFIEDNYITCLYESIKFEQEEWVFKLIQLIATCFNTFIGEQGNSRERIVGLPFDHIKALLNRDDLQVENEDMVFNLVVDYLKFREGLNEKEIVLGSKKTEKEEVNKEKGEEDNEENKEEKKEEEQKEEEQKEEVSEDDVENLEKKANLLLTNYKLSDIEKKELLNLVRLKFVSHGALINAVKEDILGPFKDMILEAISAKLAVYENTNTNYSITLQPRDCYSDEKLKTAGDLNKLFKTLPQEPVKQESNQIPKNQTYNPHLNKQTKNKMNTMVHPPIQTQKNVKVIELEESNSIQQNFLDSSTRQVKKSNRIEFSFNYNFDENGVFYWLGTNGKTSKYINPYSSGLVKVFFSSINDKCRYDTLVGRQLENCRTGNQMNSYMGVDLGRTRTLVPKNYTIRNRDCGTHVLVNWVLEVSMDYDNWYEIDRRIHQTEKEEYNMLRRKERETLMQKGAITTWVIDSGKLKDIVKLFTIDYKKFKGFRYYRLKQIGMNSHGSYNMALSGFELYGIGHGDWTA